MLAFVEGVSGQPGKAALRRLGEVVDALSAPRGLVDVVDGARYEGGGDSHLLGQLRRVALSVPGQRRSLLPVDRCEAGAVSPLRLPAG